MRERLAGSGHVGSLLLAPVFGRFKVFKVFELFEGDLYCFVRTEIGCVDDYGIRRPHRVGFTLKVLMAPYYVRKQLLK